MPGAGSTREPSVGASRQLAAHHAGCWRSAKGKPAGAGLAQVCTVHIEYVFFKMIFVNYTEELFSVHELSNFVSHLIPCLSAAVLSIISMKKKPRRCNKYCKDQILHTIVKKTSF